MYKQLFSLIHLCLCLLLGMGEVLILQEAAAGRCMLGEIGSWFLPKAPNSDHRPHNFESQTRSCKIANNAVCPLFRHLQLALNVLKKGTPLYVTLNLK